MKKLFLLLLAAVLCLPTMQGVVKVHTIGDSTMAEYDENTTDKRGWGMYLGSFFDPAYVTVNNRGKSGADSRSFYTGAAYWQSVKSQMSAGDYLIIQFAHNDEGTITHGTDNLEYLAYCQTIKPDTVLSDARGTNPQTTFRDFMGKYIDEARALGVTPILMAPICRAYFNGNTIKRNGQHDLGDNFWKIENGQLLTNQSLPANDSSMSYVHAMREVAKEKNVVFLNLMEETKKIYLSYETGDDCLDALFTWKDDSHAQHDATHTNDLGAMKIAGAAAQLLKNEGILAEYIDIPTDISVSPNAFELGEIYCSVAQNKEFLLTGSGLEPAEGSVALRATANLQISLDKSTYASSANADYSGGSMFRKVYVRAQYATGGEQLDTVFVTAGKKEIAIPVHANAISLEGGIDVSATWAINAKPMPAPVIEGPITAAYGLSNMTYSDYSKDYFTDGDQTGIVMARFHNSDAGGSSKVDWPAGEIDENADRYIDFAVTAPASMDIRITGISFDVTADATTDMCYHINAGLGDGFTNVVTLAEKKGLSNREVNHVSHTPSLTIPAGKTIHIRILPWINTASSLPNKYICLKNVVISGKAFAAEENPEDQPGEGEATATFAWAVGNEAAPAVTSEKSDYVSQTKLTVGSGLTVGTYANYAANPNKTMTTYVPAASNAGNKPEVMIEYSVKMKKGTKFALKSVSYDALKEGTDNASYSWSYAIDGVESNIINVSKDNLLRNNNSNASTAQLNHTHDIDATAAQTVALRIYVSGFGNTKKFALSNVQLIGVISGEPEARAFKDFKVDFRTNPATVLLPESGELPEGVTIPATFHDDQHGISNGTITVPVDGPVKFTFGTCKHGTQSLAIQKDGDDLTTISTFGDPCDTNTSFDKFVTWTYNSEEPATLTFTLSGYMPYFFAEACEYIPQVEVMYYDVDGKTLIGKETVDGGSELAYAYGAENVTVATGKAFRGWFTSADPTAAKVPAGTLLTENLKLYARTTDIEVAAVGAIYDYDLTKAYFYPEDHELLSVKGGSYQGAQHGWTFVNGNSLSIDVAGNALLVVSVCTYSTTGTTEVKDAAGNKVGELTIVREQTGDGSEQTIRYEGPATTLTLNFTATNYIHSLKVFNVESLPTKNEATGFYEIAAGDAAALILALQTVDAGDKIFLPNGVYDLGERVLTQISKSNIAIIGQSMEGTIIRNAPDFHNEGIATTATIFIPNNVENTYFQDLTLQNALDYYGALASGMSGARAVALHDKGSKTICKNVRLLSYQDTYYSNKQGAVKYFEDCEIHGTVDFICGDGSVYFKNNLLYCEKRNADGKGTDALTANNGPSTDRGYVFDSCTVKSECPTVSLGRAWNNTPSTVFLNTLVDYSAGSFAFTGSGIQRWTLELMNAGAWPLFGEYNTRLADGTVLTPGSNVVPFIDKKVTPNETRELETVLSAEKAAAYTMAYTLGDWAETAANDVAQLEATPKAIAADATYLVEDKGAFVALIKGADLAAAIDEYSDKTIRQANARGGFGPAVSVVNHTIDVNSDDENQEAEAEKVTEQMENVQTDAHDNHVVVTWPVSENAETYTLEIKKGSELICTLIFSKDGRLTGISLPHAPERNGKRMASAATMTENGGMRFTVTGLEAGTKYQLSIIAKGAADHELASYSANFETTGTATAINQITNDQSPMTNKIIRDGQLLILRGDKTYTLTGAELK